MKEQICECGHEKKYHAQGMKEDFSSNGIFTYCGISTKTGKPDIKDRCPCKKFTPKQEICENCGFGKEGHRSGNLCGYPYGDKKFKAKSNYYDGDPDFKDLQYGEEPKNLTCVYCKKTWYPGHIYDCKKIPKTAMPGRGVKKGCGVEVVIRYGNKTYNRVCGGVLRYGSKKIILCSKHQEKKQ